MKNKQKASKKIEKVWKRLNYWQKGATVGFILGIFLLVTIGLIRYHFGGPLDVSDIFTGRDVDVWRWPTTLGIFFFPFMFIGKFFFLDFFHVCSEFGEGSLCDTLLPYFMIIVTYVFFGFLVGLILFYINEEYKLNKLSKKRYYALLGFIIIFLFTLAYFIQLLPHSAYSLLFLLPYRIIIYPILIFGFTLYFFILGWAYEFMKKKKWCNLIGKIMYYTTFLILFVIMWVYIILILTFIMSLSRIFY